MNQNTLAGVTFRTSHEVSQENCLCSRHPAPQLLQTAVVTFSHGHHLIVIMPTASPIPLPSLPSPSPLPEEGTVFIYDNNSFFSHSLRQSHSDVLKCQLRLLCRIITVFYCDAVRLLGCRNAGGEPQVSLGELRHASWKQLLRGIPTYFLTKEVKSDFYFSPSLFLELVLK